jgi:hypothetical protein
MYKLQQSDIVDLQRSNVIIVITESLSFPKNADSGKEHRTFHRTWNEDAMKKVKIIHTLQRRLFLGAQRWPVVFIENKEAVKGKYPRLPNGELSHQNLFEAILDLIRAPGGNGMLDLNGLLTLRLLAKGVTPSGIPLEPKLLPVGTDRPEETPEQASTSRLGNFGVQF